MTQIEYDQILGLISSNSGSLVHKMLSMFCFYLEKCLHCTCLKVILCFFSLPVMDQSSAAVMVCMDLNRQTSLPKVPASWTGTMTFLCQCSRIYRHDSPATLQFQPAKLMRQQERWAAVGASWRGSELRLERSKAGRLWPLHTAGLVPWPGSMAGPLAVTLCVCNCLVVIRSSHCTTAPSHLQGGSAGHTAPFSASASLALASHKEGEGWNSLCLLLLNINS